jgi:hypothetical protein
VRPTLNQIERACADLARNGHPITIAKVAEHAGISRSTIDELVVAVGLVDPSSLFRVAGESVGVDALCGEDRQRGSETQTG